MILSVARAYEDGTIGAPETIALAAQAAPAFARTFWSTGNATVAIKSGAETFLGGLSPSNYYSTDIPAALAAANTPRTILHEMSHGIDLDSRNSGSRNRVGTPPTYLSESPSQWQGHSIVAAAMAALISAGFQGTDRSIAATYIYALQDSNEFAAEYLAAYMLSKVAPTYDYTPEGQGLSGTPSQALDKLSNNNATRRTQLDEWAARWLGFTDNSSATWTSPVDLLRTFSGRDWRFDVFFDFASGDERALIASGGLGSKAAVNSGVSSWVDVAGSPWRPGAGTVRSLTGTKRTEGLDLQNNALSVTQGFSGIAVFLSFMRFTTPGGAQTIWQSASGARSIVLNATHSTVTVNNGSGNSVTVSLTSLPTSTFGTIRAFLYADGTISVYAALGTAGTASLSSSAGAPTAETGWSVGALSIVHRFAYIATRVNPPASETAASTFNPF